MPKMPWIVYDAVVLRDAGATPGWFLEEAA